MGRRNPRVLLEPLSFPISTNRRSLHSHNHPQYLQVTHSKVMLLPLRTMAIPLRVIISRRPKLRIIHRPHIRRRKLIINGHNQVINQIQVTRNLRVNLLRSPMHHHRATIKDISLSMRPLTPINRLMDRIQRGHSSRGKHPISQTNTAQSTDYPTIVIPRRILTLHQLRRLFISLHLVPFHRLISPLVL